MCIRDTGTAVNVQQMAFGNSGMRSGTGVAFTRNPANGEKKLMGEYLINAQGEAVVAGIRTPSPISKLHEMCIRDRSIAYNIGKAMHKGKPRPSAEVCKSLSLIHISADAPTLPSPVTAAYAHC